MERVRASLEGTGVEIEVLDRPAMEKLGMGALLGVAQGSVREARLLVMRWNGAGNGGQPVAFVGKGVTFDTGGISIKPAAGHGSHEVGHGRRRRGRRSDEGARLAKGEGEHRRHLRVWSRTCRRRAAQRPGDVVTTNVRARRSRSSTPMPKAGSCSRTRLPSSQRNYKPSTIIDLATLTGAILISLGHEWAGLFSNNDDLASGLQKAGRDERRQAVAHAAWRSLRSSHRFADRGHEECRPA